MKQDSYRFASLSGRSRRWLSEEDWDDAFFAGPMEWDESEHDGWSEVVPRRRARPGPDDRMAH